jgi:hypothetical protein
MGELFAVLLGVVLASSFVALGLYLVMGVAVTVSTLRVARRDRQLAEEVDRAILAILGPRSAETTATTFTAQSVRRHRAA